jgi:hypothetical protein
MPTVSWTLAGDVHGQREAMLVDHEVDLDALDFNVVAAVQGEVNGYL